MRLHCKWSNLHAISSCIVCVDVKRFKCQSCSMEHSKKTALHSWREAASRQGNWQGRLLQLSFFEPKADSATGHLAITLLVGLWHLHWTPGQPFSTPTAPDETLKFSRWCKDQFRKVQNDIETVEFKQHPSYS